MDPEPVPALSLRRNSRNSCNYICIIGQIECILGQAGGVCAFALAEFVLRTTDSTIGGTRLDFIE